MLNWNFTKKPDKSFKHILKYSTMNRISLNFGLPFWLFIIFVVFSLIATFFYYRKTNPDLELRSKLGLGALRVLALLFLFFFFTEPILNFIQSQIEKPKVLFLVDNSMSMKIKWEVPSEDGKIRTIDKYNQTKQAITQTGIENFSKYPSEFWKFDQDFKIHYKFSFDSLNFNGSETKLATALKRINSLKREENIGAIFLITDGIVNSGENPATIAEKIGIPIYTVAVGDSIPPKDIVVTNIVTNEIGFVEKTQPVKVSIKSFGFDDKEVNVQLFEGKNLVSEKKMMLSKTTEDYSVVFDYTPKAEGFVKLTAKVQNNPNEFSFENNSQTQIIKILKNQKKYVLLSGYPNPDLSYIKSLILQEKGSELVSFIQKQGAEFYEPKPAKKDFEEAKVIVLLGFPISSSPTQFLDWVREEWNKGKPVLFIPQLETEYNKLKGYEELLPFNVVSNSKREYTFVANFKQSQIGNPILRVATGEESIKILNQLPPIFRTELFVRPKIESEVLASVKVGNADLKEPFLLTYEFQNKKSAAILGYGLFRWRLLGHSLQELMNQPNKETDPGSTIIVNLLNWLSSSEEFVRVKIKPTKNKFDQFEQVTFNGQVYDETLSPVEDAIVKVKIKKGDGQIEKQLPQVASGVYSGSLGTFDIGEYSYIGEAYRAGKLIGSYSGKFIIEKSNLELTDFRTRFDFLRYISQNSGGKFFYWNEVNKIKEELNSLSLTNKVITKKEEKNLWNSLPLLIVSILLFGIEWFFRRIKGLL